MAWGEILIVLFLAFVSFVLLGAVFVRGRRMDGSGLSGGLPFYPSTASGGFAETPKPAWATDPEWRAEIEAEGTDERDH